MSKKKRQAPPGKIHHSDPLCRHIRKCKITEGDRRVAGSLGQLGHTAATALTGAFMSSALKSALEGFVALGHGDAPLSEYSGAE